MARKPGDISGLRRIGPAPPGPAGGSGVNRPACDSGPFPFALRPHFCHCSPMTQDYIFRQCGDWSLASDGIQWMLMKRYNAVKQPWRPVSFVRSTKDILARCMREKGVGPDTADFLLLGLPDSFDRWKSHWDGSIGRSGIEPAGPSASLCGSSPWRGRAGRNGPSG